MQRKRNRKKINILMNQKIAAAKKTGETNKRGSDELDSSDRPKKKPMVIEFDDNLRLQGTSIASNEKSTREFLDALQSLRSNQELQHVLQYMNKFSVPPPNVSMPPPMNVKPPPRIQFAPLTPHTFYPRPPFMIRYVNRAFVMRKVPRAIPVKAHVLAKTESITDVPLSELMMRSKKSGEAVVPHAKVYEVSRGNPWMRSFQSVYLRPPFPSRTYRRPILSNVGFTGTFYIPSPIESAPKDVKATNVAIMDDKIDEKKGDAETKAREMDISCDGANKGKGDTSFDGDINDKTVDESGLVECETEN
ncbi:unnamed protein product [Acanthoscelides obtectus]|uniref:Uncharacterized protein n=1 Tax=Acanthoscelides obtectus TaxID=200917 RepID=A0A9P0P044_ACAOB|nr:unnamed protein product [Acanthoscelides obtectus]CAK1669710.1 hypothetical protein AOBTE_LOCUS27194 [Acanthoscelides obtectus]